MNVHPWEEIILSAAATINRGGTVFQQFNCANCGAKQTMDVPNKFFTEGRCEECHHVTDLVKNGCNYMAMFGKDDVKNFLDEIS